jgi:hypothetical protein
MAERTIEVRGKLKVDYLLLSKAAPSPGGEWVGGGEIVLAIVVGAFDPTLWDELVWIVEILGATVYDPLVRCHLGLRSTVKD